MFRRQRLELGAAVEIGLGPDAVHERDRFGVALFEKVEDHRPRARHAGAAGEKEERAAARLAHDEAAVGAAERDAVAELQRFVDIAGAGAAGDAPDLQFDLHWGSDGALAIEKARGPSTPGSLTITYCPA